jgi:DNA-binding PadR family transcriptional regulator
VKPLLRSVELHILLSLAEEDRHGYAIRSSTAERTEGELLLEPGTIYRALSRLLQLGYVGEAPLGRGEDERRRKYALSATGRRVLVAEMQRMAKLVSVAQRARILGSKP